MFELNQWVKFGRKDAYVRAITKNHDDKIISVDIVLFKDNIILEDVLVSEIKEDPNADKKQRKYLTNAGL